VYAEGNRLKGGINVAKDGRSLMSTLTYASRDIAAVAPAPERPARKSIWRRVANSFVEAQQRRAAREIARYLASHGGLMTDGMERELMRRLAGSGGRLR